MGLLVISFAVWGVNDVFTGYSTTAVAEVGGEPISVDEYQRAVDEKIRDFSQRLGQPLTRQQASQYGIDRTALSELVGLAAFDIGARQNGLTVSDEKVAQNITSDPAFTSTFGKFDRDGFSLALQRMGVTERAFIEDRRKFLVRLQLNKALEAGVDVPQAMLDAISTYQGETRRAKYLILPPALVGEIADPDEKVLEAYYKKAAMRFTTPELRSFTVMSLSPADLAATVSISDEELASAYEQRRSEFDQPERRTIIQIPFATEEAAKAADERLRAGEAVKTIVSELGLGMSEVELGNVTRAQMLSPEVAEVAFTIEAGTFSEPVKGPLGYAILYVSDVTAAVPSTFEGVKDELRQKLAMEHAQNQVYDVQNDIEDSRAGGTSLEETAAKNNLKVTKYEGLSALGLTLDGKKPENLPAYKDLMQMVFENQVGDMIAPADNNDGGFYWVRVDDVTAAALKPLDEVRADVLKLWKEETRKAKLEELAQSLVARGEKGESIEKIASSMDRAALTSPDMKRSSQSETFSRLVVTRVFAQPEGGFTYGPVGFGDSLLLAQVENVTRPAPDTGSDEYKTIKTNLEASMTNDMLISTVAGFERDLGTEINTQLLDRLSQESTQ